MASIETMINWMEQRQGKISYSMASRFGPNSYDCSSAVYFALRAGGFLDKNTMGNTDTLFSHLEKQGWKQASSPKRGDVFIWGKRGASGGAYGHTGIFVDSIRVIHCNASKNGISTDNYNSIWSYRKPPATIYHNPNTTDTTPTLNTEEEKTAWALASLLSQEGYSLASIAGICGNIEIESGMKPDIDQIGGPAYGLVQWDGSAYPLVGTPTRNGREYVQRLMKKASLSGDYRHAEPQVRLIDWCMQNGQWIGAVEPKSVDAFKKTSDVTTATVAFLKNFERAGVEKQQKRIDAANKWYTFLNGLPYEEETSEGYETLTNMGELEILGINNGKVIASGWHFSSDKDLEYIAFINAQTNEEIAYVRAEPIERPDLKEKYTNVLGIENAGFEVSMDITNHTAVYVKGYRTDGIHTDELIFDKIIYYEQAEEVSVDERAKYNEQFYFEIINQGKVIKRGRKTLSDLSWSNELMYTPTVNMTLPIEYLEYTKAREEMKIYINRKVFHGIITSLEVNKQDETITINLTHIITEWGYRQISTNLAAKNRTISDIYSTYDFRYPNWNINYLQDSATRVIDYVYSRQNKLEGLTTTCELTPDLFWRVGFNAGRTLDIGSFGEKKPYMISTKPSSQQNIRMLTEPVITHEFENVINIATVYGEKSDSGMSSMSLREVYEENGAWDPAFPIVILKKGINNERGYDYIEFTKLAPNNELEYSVIDKESIALEGGLVIEGTFSFNDLAPFNTDGQEITDEDRAKASKMAYDTAVKRLKQSRRKYTINLEVEEVPYDLQVGDKIRLVYDNQLLILEDCSNYMRKILQEDDWYYITAINYNFDKSGVESNSITLAKFLQIDRESDLQ